MNQAQSLQPQAKNHSSKLAPERLLPLPKVEESTGFKSSYIYELIKSGGFPAPVKIGSASRWRQSEIQEWIAQRIQESTDSKQTEGSHE